MKKAGVRSYLDDGLFVVLIMAAALASAALEVGALMGAVSPSSVSQKMARAGPPAASASDAEASAVAGSGLGAVLARASSR